MDKAVAESSPILLPGDDVDNNEDDWAAVVIRRKSGEEDIRVGGCCPWIDRVESTKAKAKGISEAATVNKAAMVPFL